MQGRSGQAGRGLIRHRGIRLGTARQVRLVLVRPVALRFVGNGQGKAGEARWGNVWNDSVWRGKAGRARDRPAASGKSMSGLAWHGRCGKASFGSESRGTG